MTRRKCPECNGEKGHVQDSGGVQPWGESIDVWAECPRCDGSGEIEETWTKNSLLRHLDDVYQEMTRRHYANAPPSGTVPVGGGDWMDYFFKAEAIRGCITSLRAGNTLAQATRDGYAVSEIAVQLWNKRREYQVHRWEKTAHDFLDRTIAAYKRRTKRR